MANFARVIDNMAVDVASDPAAQFHPVISAEFVAVPDGVRPGWRLVAGTWQAPAPVEPAPQAEAAPKVGPIEFKLLFTPQERLAIKAARERDPAVADFFELIEDPRLTFVDLGLSSTQEALAYLEHVALIGPGRAVEIATGQFQ